MLKYKNRLFNYLFLIQILIPITSLHPNEQSWLNNSLTLSINENLDIKVTQETRYNELTFIDAYLRNWQVGLVYRLSKALYISPLYKRESKLDRKNSFIAENRFTMETGRKGDLSENTDLSIRFRTEIRRYPQLKENNHLRFRLCVKIVSKMKIQNLSLNPFIAIEPFANTMDKRVNMYRLYAGSELPLGKNVKLIINYILQDISGGEKTNILNSGLSVKL